MTSNLGISSIIRLPAITMNGIPNDFNASNRLPTVRCVRSSIKTSSFSESTTTLTKSNENAVPLARSSLLPFYKSGNEYFNTYI